MLSIIQNFRYYKSRISKKKIIFFPEKIDTSETLGHNEQGGLHI